MYASDAQTVTASTGASYRWLREATGIGEFAPQYGPRRGLFAEFTQQL